VLLLSAGCAVGTGAGGSDEFAETQEALEVGGECVVADAVIGHTCGHATFGPFQSVTAQPYPGPVFTDISAPHTAFHISLPASGGQYQGAVLYAPGASGRYAFFMTPGVTLSVVDGSGTPVPLAIESEVPAELCGAIEHVAVFELDSSQTYTLIHGPAPAASVQMIVEFIGEGSCESCAGVDLDASLSLLPWSRQDGEVELDEPLSFEVPGEVEVIDGNAKIGTTTLSFRSGNGPLVHCLYVAKPVHNHFELVGCTGGFGEGDPAEADYFKLRINPGAALFGPLFVELEITEAGCEDDHDDDHEEAP
jgi:hypothetical protein